MWPLTNVNVDVNMRMCCLIIETVTDTILGKKGKSEHSNKL